MRAIAHTSVHPTGLEERSWEIWPTKTSTILPCKPIVRRLNSQSRRSIHRRSRNGRKTWRKSRRTKRPERARTEVASRLAGVAATQRSGAAIQPVGLIPSIQATVKLSIFTLAVTLFLAGCTTHDRSPEEIRRETAHATSTATRDAKAVAQGVVDGVKQEHHDQENHDAHPASPRPSSGTER